MKPKVLSPSPEISLDVTERKRAEESILTSEERFRFLNELSEATSTLTDPDEIMKVMSRMLGELLRASRCAYATVSGDGEQFTVLHDYVDGCASVVGSYSFSLFGSQSVATLKDGQTLIIRTAETGPLRDDRADRFNAKAIITCPLVKKGRLRAMMAVHQTTPRDWTPGEVSIVQEVAERCWATIERMTAEAALRESEALLAASQRITHLGSWIMDISESGTVVDNSERWSDEHYRIFGFEPGEIELTDEVFYQCVHPDDREPLAKMLRETIEHQQPSDLEHRIILPDGTERIVHAMAEVVVDVNTGKPLTLLGSVQDITERKRHEAARLASESKYQNIFTLAPVGIYQSQPDGSLTTVNAALADILGYDSSDELLTKNLSDIYFDPEGRRELLDRYEERGFAADIEVQWRRKDDSPIWIQLTALAIKGPDGETEYFEGFVRDISESKQNEAALRLSQERYRDLVENATDIIYTHDLKGNYTSVNEAAERITGYTNAEILTMNIGDTIPAGQLEKTRQMIAAKLAGEKITAYELELLGKDGRSVTVEVNTRIIYENGVPVGVQGIARDITNRKRAEREIRLLPTMIRVGLVALVVLSLGGFIQEGLHQSTGYWTSVTFPVIFGVIAAVAIAYFAMKRHRAMYRRTMDEIAERKRTQSALEESEASFKSLFDTANDAILVVNEGIFRACNPAAEKLFGRNNQEIVGHSPVEFSPREQPDGRLSSEKAAEHIQAAMTGEPQFFEWTHSRLDGTPFDAEVSLNRVDFGGATHLQATVRDITARKLAKEAIQEKAALLEAQVNSTIDGILVVDQNGSKIIQNQQLVDLFKIPRDVANDPDDSKLLKWVTDMMKDPETFIEKVLHLYSHPEEVSRDEIELKDGTILDRYSAPVIGKDEKSYGRIWTFRDITHQKRTNDALRESDEKFHQLADNITDVFWIRSPDMSRVYYISPAYERIWGRQVEDNHAEPHMWYDFIVPVDRQRVKEAYAALMHESRYIEIEYRIVRTDDEIRWVRARGFQVRDASGDLIRLAGIVTDITDKKHSETEIELTMRRLSDAQRIGKIGDWQWDRATEAITWSREVFEIVGRHPGLGPPNSYEEQQEYYDAPSQKTMDRKVAAAIESGESQEYELVVVRPDGERVYVHAMCEPKKHDDGHIFALAGTIQDISARKLSEAALMDSEFRYHSLFENMIEGYAYCQTIFKKDKLRDFIYTEVNGAFETLTGLKDVAGKRVSDLIPGLAKTNPELFETYGRVALTGQPEKFETYVEPLKIWLSITVYSSNRDNFVAVFDNITESKRSEEAIRESEVRYRLLFEANPHPMWVYDLETLRFLAVNDAAVMHYGYSHAEFMAMTIKEIRPLDEVPKLLESVYAPDRIQAKAHSWLHRKKDGSIIDVEITANELIFAGRRAEVVLANDVTERTRAEAALRGAEEKYRSIFENSLEGIFQSTPEGKFISVNPAMAHIMGFESPAELMAQRSEIGSQHYVEPNCRAELGRMLADEGTVVGFECEVFRKDLSKIWTGTNIRVVRDESGAILRYEGSLEDITERKRGEAIQARREVQVALRADINAALVEPDVPLQRTLERCTHAMVEHLDAAFARVWTLNKEKNVLELQASAGLYTHIDGPHGSVPVGMFKIGLIAEERRPHITNDVQNDPRVGAQEWARQEGMVAFAGYPLIIEDRLVGVVAMFTRQKLPEDTLDGLAAVANIMSHGIERKRAEEALRASEEQLRQSQKMEAVGALAGGIAHDFNNLLTAINGYSDMTLKKMAPDDPLRGNIVEVKNAGSRAAELTTQLLAFSRKQVLKLAVINLNSVVANIENMLRRIIRESIELRVVLDPKLGNVRADPGQIEQVIMNLAVNARDAMPERGTLTIETQNVYLDDDYVSQHIDVSPGEFVKMTVTDTGEGMNEATRSHIFEPFFTTKEVGKGTGLGLATVYGIVKQSSGDILVYSEVGRGTTFEVYLPCIDEAVQKRRWTGDIRQSYSGTETILVVEDEEIVRKLVCEILGDSGYNVLAAAGGHAALAILDTYTKPIQLLLTDVIMPKMGGSELRARVIKRLPDIKVIFMSGYTDDSIADRGIYDEDIAFIEKPFTPDALARKVHEVLER